MAPTTSRNSTHALRRKRRPGDWLGGTARRDGVGVAVPREERGGGGCGGPGARRGEFGWDKAEEGDDEERRPSSGGGGGIRWLPPGDI
nr:unnamed protein product [Digitaria exilis]